jgi:hypothetical protein
MLQYWIEFDKPTNFQVLLDWVVGYPNYYFLKKLNN